MIGRASFLLLALAAVTGGSLSAVGCSAGTATANDDAADGNDNGGNGDRQSDAGPRKKAGSEPKRHRPAEVACENNRPPTQPDEPDAGNPSSDCHADTDCTAGKDGRCVNIPPGDYRTCTYAGCAADSECKGGVCECGINLGSSSCLSGNCRVDAECGTGGYCSPSAPNKGACGHFGVPPTQSNYFCHTPDDECLDDDECPDDPSMNGSAGYCAYDAVVGHWKCAVSTCYVG